MDVAIDSQILSFLLKRQPPGEHNPNQDVAEMFRRSRLLLRELKSENTRIFIPTVVVAEVLIGVDQLRHGEFVAALEKHFIIVPLDIHATSLAAKLWIKNHDGPSEDAIERKYLKSDVLIVATALVAGAKVFYSHDKKCRKLADRAGMIGRDLPETSRYLFDLTESEDLRLPIPSPLPSS